MTTSPLSCVRSYTSSAVSNLTVLAGGKASAGFRLNKTLPLAASTSSALVACTFRLSSAWASVWAAAPVKKQLQKQQGAHSYAMQPTLAILGGNFVQARASMSATRPVF
jgi:hypothetical protein